MNPNENPRFDFTTTNLQGRKSLFCASKLALPALICAIIASGCKTAEKPATIEPGGPPKQFTSQKTGRMYSYVIVADSDEEFERFEISHGLHFGPPSAENFVGTDRKAAKTSISSGPQDTRADVAELLANLPETDSNMVNHTPPISKSATSNRLAEEQHNVVVTSGFIYAIAKESDNDYHIILGTAPGGTPQFMNVEVSGLPITGQFRAPLKQVREKFQNFFGTTISGSGYHKMVGDPVPVRVTGSLFFDIDHAAGKVGPVGLRPTTAWEIHPVTDIEFEP